VAGRSQARRQAPRAWKRPHRLVATAVAAVLLAASAAVLPQVLSETGASAQTGGQILILSTSVSGGSESPEAQAAIADGYSVSVVDPSSWGAMTQSQFAGYQAIVLGDPSTSSSCASDPSSAVAAALSEQTGVTPPSGDPTAYGWDTLSNEMVCVNTNGTTCSTSDPTSTTSIYSYDAGGLRTSATEGSSTTSFTWDTAAGNPQLATDGTWDYLYSPGGAVPIEQVSASGPSPTSDLLVTDPSGNVRGIVQLSAGTYQDELVNYTDYDAYGDPITDSGGSSETGGVSSAQTGINANYVGTTVWGFGEGHTDATGLVYLIHRYYDPITGQLTSVDPDLSQTAQPYEYANDAPTRSVDPDGTNYGPYLGKTPSEAWNFGLALLFGGLTLEAAGLSAPVIGVILSLIGQATDYIGEGYLACATRGWLYNTVHHRARWRGGCGIEIITWWIIPVDVEVWYFAHYP
jgi:RHS repeat-associated protein